VWNADCRSKNENNDLLKGKVPQILPFRFAKSALIQKGLDSCRSVAVAVCLLAVGHGPREHPLMAHLGNRQPLNNRKSSAEKARDIMNGENCIYVCYTLNTMLNEDA
jgi:hypothetical protein